MKNIILAVLVSVFGLLSFGANAALPASVSTDISTTATDAATLGGLVLALVVGIAVFKHLRSAK